MTDTAPPLTEENIRKGDDMTSEIFAEWKAQVDEGAKATERRFAVMKDQLDRMVDIMRAADERDKAVDTHDASRWSVCLTKHDTRVIIEAPGEGCRLGRHSGVHHVLVPGPQPPAGGRESHLIVGVEGLVVRALLPQQAGEIEQPGIAGDFVDVEGWNEPLEPAVLAPVEQWLSLEARPERP